VKSKGRKGQGHIEAECWAKQREEAKVKKNTKAEQATTPTLKAIANDQEADGSRTGSF